MESGMYVLMRFFLRVDSVIVRLHDTRIYHQVNPPSLSLSSSDLPSPPPPQAGTDYLTREHSCKEGRLEKMRLPTSVLTDPDRLNNILSPTDTKIHKLILPK